MILHISNCRCHLCNINATDKRTKHCSICNKCITRFDHHCKWLNNCIGGRNYKVFIVCLTSAIISTFTVASVSTTELSLAYLNVGFEAYNMTTDNVTLPISLQLPGTGSLIVISVVGIISAIAAVLLIHLCFFHGYIACLGLTTYEYLRNKREKNTTTVAATSSTNSGIVATCPSFCNSNDDVPLRYHFCEAVSAAESNQIESNNVYICSTHGEQTTSTQMGVTQKERRNFHLYFSYEARNSETSIELTSQTILDDNRPINLSPNELKPSTPSPVSCCFSIIGPSTKAIRASKQKKNRDSDVENAKGAPRSCTTMRRIQTFLRTRLRKNAIQRSIHSDGSSNRKSRVSPAITNESANGSAVECTAVVPKVRSPVHDLSPPKLQPLNLPPRPRLKQISVVGAPSYPFPNPAIPKRSQAHFRVRRSSLHKRPRFKMGSHVMQSAQLSPIPESELSKPASPRSPPHPNHFTFPPSHQGNL